MPETTPPRARKALDLALHQVAHLLDDGLEDVAHLRRRNDEEARVEPGVGVVEPRQRGVELVELVLVEVALDVVLEHLEPHLPRLALARLHVVEARRAQPAADVFLKAVVEKGGAAEATGAEGRLFDAERLERHDFVRDEAARTMLSAKGAARGLLLDRPPPRRTR